MIHRVVYGSIERFIGILIEHYAGAFPMWLAPTQIKILTLNEEVIPYAKELQQKLQDLDLRAELDDRAESIGYKIREANGKYKIPPLRAISGLDFLIWDHISCSHLVLPITLSRKLPQAPKLEIGRAHV